MTDAHRVLAVVPARAGSLGVRGKNMRLVDDKPLVGHILDTLKQAGLRTVVTTDDDRLAAWASIRGVQVIRRPATLARPEVPVTEPVRHVCETLNHDGPVLVAQPTCPQVTPDTIRRLLASLDGKHSVLSTYRTHLYWWETTGGRLPLQDRVNRQTMDSRVVSEVGVRLFASPDVLAAPPDRFVNVDADQAVDIDTHPDLAAARMLAGRRKVEVWVTVSERVGSGHLRRGMQLADELSHHHVHVHVTADRADDVTRAAELEVHRAGYGPCVDCTSLPTVLTVFDVLDTTVEQVARVKAAGSKVVCIEDLGPGSDLADLVVNELYDDWRSQAVCGPKWAVLGPEFLGLPERNGDDGYVLTTLGGTDPSHLSERVARAASQCGLPVRAVVGPAFRHRDLPDIPNVTWVRDVQMVGELWGARLAVTSNGRTVHEAAAVGCPVLTVAANEREDRHSHCAGVHRLGLHVSVSDIQLAESIGRLVESPGLLAEMATTARAEVDGRGLPRIVAACEWHINGLGTTRRVLH